MHAYTSARHLRHVTSGGAAAGVLCGAAASGQFTWTPEHVAQSAVCMLMSGPFLTGYTQTINDYYDREIDAINEPYRPIPSGAAPRTPSPARAASRCGPRCRGRGRA
jgi:4-hydroxybenzoate polyprenyltransferase